MKRLEEMKLEARKEINIYRRYFSWRKFGCIYIHIPKAAGTSINKAIYGKTLGHYKAQEIKSKFPSLYEKSFVFSFVRNPWDRVASAYRFVKSGGTSTMRVYKPEQYRRPEFDSFEKFVLEWLPKQDLSKVDVVFQPQSFFVCDKHDDISVDYLGKIENIASDIENVSAKVGYYINLKRENSTGTPKDYRELYKNDDMIRQVYDIYKSDVDAFDYSF